MERHWCNIVKGLKENTRPIHLGLRAWCKYFLIRKMCKDLFSTLRVALLSEPSQFVCPSLLTGTKGALSLLC